jgi:hypothetical protein
MRNVSAFDALHWFAKQTLIDAPTQQFDVQG